MHLPRGMSNHPVQIEEWAVAFADADNPNAGFRAPEIRPRCLVGVVYGHPRKSDGTRVKTSSLRMLDTSARKAVSSSGTWYQLGDPHPEYVEAMRKLGREV